MNMTVFIIIFFIIIVSIVLYINRNKEVKELIDWNTLYNTSIINNSILLFINKYLENIKINESLDTGLLSGIDIFYRATYPDFSTTALINSLKDNYDKKELIQFFVLNEIGNSKYKINEYRSICNEIELFLDKNNNHKTLHYFLNIKLASD
jgi:hypothetical protein